MSKIGPVDKLTQSLSEVTIGMAEYTKLERITECQVANDLQTFDEIIEVK